MAQGFLQWMRSQASFEVLLLVLGPLGLVAALEWLALALPMAEKTLALALHMGMGHRYRWEQWWERWELMEALMEVCT